MLKKQNLNLVHQAEEEMAPHYIYLESEDMWTVILTNKISSEYELDKVDLIAYVSNIINEFTNFTIFLKCENYNQQSQTFGKLCQAKTQKHLYLRDFELQQENGYYIKFLLCKESASQQLKTKLRKANLIIKKLQSLKIESSEEIYDSFLKWLNKVILIQ